MEQIDFTKLSFEEAVSTAMKELGLDQMDAEEFINLVQGGESDDMNISTKAGNSTGAKKGWLSRARGGMNSYQNKRREVVRGGIKKTFGKKLYNKLYAGINNATLIGSERKKWHYNPETGTRQKIKEVTFKAGNSAGVKKGWVTRLWGGAHKVVGNHPLIMGARLMGKTPGGKMATNFGKSAGSAAVRAGGSAKKFAGTERGKKIIKGALIGGAIIGGSALAVGAARSKTGRSTLSKFGKAIASRKRTGPVQSSFNQRLSEHLKPTIMKGPSTRSKVSTGIKKAGEFITGRGQSHGTHWTQTNSIPGAIKKVGRGSKAAVVRAASKVNLHNKFKYEYGGKLRSGTTYNHAISPRIRHYGSKEYTKKELSLSAEVERSWEEYESKEMDLTITKDANDKWRWTLFSTNAFEDKDGEVVSKKALDNDLARSEVTYKETENYGPLRWWHVVLGENPEKDGLDIGQCDFRGMEDRILIESGTFENEELGELLAPHAKELGGSIGFYHSTSEPDSDKVFNSIRIFERSLLPRERASNPLAQLIIEKEGGIMVKEKIEKLNAILGGADKAEKVLGKAKEAQAAAEAEGVRTKEVVATKDDEPVVDASDELTQEEWDGFVEAVGAALEQLGESDDTPEVETDTKEYDELKATLKEINDGQGKLADALVKLDSRLKSLEGEQPTGTQFVASTSDKTKTKEVPAEPRGDPLNLFVDSFVLKK